MEGTLWIILFHATLIYGKCLDNTMGCPMRCTCRWPTGGDVAIDCQHRNLDRIPDLPSSATHLYLSNNAIDRIDQIDFANCSNLRALDLSHNKIGQIDRESFRDTTNIERLLLENNKINIGDTNTSLPLGVFGPVSRLTELRMYSNVLEDYQQYREDWIQNKPELTYLALDAPGNVPLPAGFSGLKSLRALDIHRGLTRLENETLSRLRGLPVNELGFLGGALTFVDVMAFSSLTSLTYLDMRNNVYLGLGKNLYQAWYGLQYTQIRILHLSHMRRYHRSKPQAVEADFFKYLDRTNITELNLDLNGLYAIFGDIVSKLPRLQKLSLAYNRLYDYTYTLSKQIFPLQELWYLDLSEQSHNPRYSGIKRTEETAEYFYIFVPPKMSVLNLSLALSSTTRKLKNVIFFTEAKYMSVLDLSNNYIPICSEGGIIVPNHTLEVEILDLSSCKLNHLPVMLLQSQILIYVLNLTDNNIGHTFSILQNKSHQLDKVSLREIYLTQNRIKELPYGYFAVVHNLQRIRLNINSLRVWNTSLAPLRNLTHLDLSENLLSSLSEQSTRELDNIAAMHSISLDLSGNPLVCQCYTLPFLRWMAHTKVILVDMQAYRCNIDGDMRTFDNLDRLLDRLTIACTSKEWLIVSGLSLGGLLLVMGVSLVLYRHRWDIKYALLRLMRQRKEDQALKNKRKFEFDAFIAYHQSDLNWVINDLIPRLERPTVESDRLRLCVHHRNWLPGPTIEENISRSVEVSRKTLVILTRKFLQSGWCELEMQLARLRGLEEGEDIIIVVALEEISMGEMSTTLVNLRRSTTWLDRYEYEHDQNLFWELLRDALSKPGQRSQRRRQSDERRDLEDVPLIN